MAGLESTASHRMLRLSNFTIYIYYCLSTSHPHENGQEFNFDSHILKIRNLKDPFYFIIPIFCALENVRLGQNKRGKKRKLQFLLKKKSWRINATSWEYVLCTIYNKYFQALIFLAPTFAQCLLLIIVTKVPTYISKKSSAAWSRTYSKDDFLN